MRYWTSEFLGRPSTVSLLTELEVVMEQKTPLLTVEQAAEFAGVNIPTIQRYTNAGFIEPADTKNGAPLYAEKDLIQVFELSPKRAAARRKIAAKKKPTKKATVITEKDRLIAEKDIQIRDLKDQREWLRSRVEKLEEELREAAENAALPVPMETQPEEDLEPEIVIEESKVEIEKPTSTITKFLRYMGFISSPEQPEPDQEEACEEEIEEEEQPIAQPALKKTDIGARPFRRSRGGDSKELLDLLGATDEEKDSTPPKDSAPEQDNTPEDENKQAGNE